MSDNTGGSVKVAGLDNPNLSQEDKDLRLAIALQQQENAAAYNAHKKGNDNAKHAKKMRTTRSSAHCGLAAIRDKDHGAHRVPNEYTTENAIKVGRQGDYSGPESSDADFAREIDDVGAATFQLQSALSNDEEEKKATALRTTRSAHSGRAKKH
eukprot:CAMPEP_0197835302 /NCGR_PEP_ID=MMETSP1437-20131217/25370_1 /TAXON_ID=49252 ORGANISM="Eucampia antarctica, Strain CCMP1452" /NCGR_SAMPLE_ID=MMETSP1437 /ASSEMBLY_ACC=CAM_ASM_001096 /LENGTH=153 /DNA_ID=CAMNT_0043440637 /DNA_START=107 /DNA_END=568 /DNA_ORIENTATION=-